MDRKYSDPNIWDNSIDCDDAPDGSDGGYTKNGYYILPPAMRELVRLRAELAECRSKPQDLHLHANGDSIDCRTCAHYLPPLSFAGDPACELVSSVIVCINGDAYVPADPVRMYETGEA